MTASYQKKDTATLIKVFKAVLNANGGERRKAAAFARRQLRDFPKKFQRMKTKKAMQVRSVY